MDRGIPDRPRRLFTDRRILMRNAVTSLLEAHREGRAAVYTELVETRGSTPQKAGAAMLVFADGSQVGTLGGGCVEAEVKRRALTLLPGGAPELMTFQLDSDYGWDDGLICGGRMRMLVDPVRPNDDLSWYEQCHARTNAGLGCTQAVLLQPAGELPAGARFLLDGDGQILARTVAGEVPAAVLDGLRSLKERPRAYAKDGVSYLPSLPRHRLIIVGAGHVGQRTAQLAAEVDFDVWIIDDRGDVCSEERFPTARQRLVGAIPDVLGRLETTSEDFGIIVTRGHNHDEEALFHLATKPFRYLGMIGSRRKIRMIFEDLERNGADAAALERVHAPLGYDIGSQTVPEIAVSIVAELIACRNRPEAYSVARSLRDVPASARGGDGPARNPDHNPEE